MRILLTGTTGKVGGILARSWTGDEIVPLTRDQVDLRDPRLLRDYLQRESFDALLNPAALSTPEGCESDPETARLVNVEAPKVMAQICAEKRAQLIHFSTDYVLDGEGEGFKDESAPTKPNNLYGESKLAGEQAVLEAHPKATIARVSWVFGVLGEAFLEKMFRKIQGGEKLEGVADKYSMPTCATELAEALRLLLDHRASGLFHVTQSAAEPVSWHSYAEEVALAAHESGVTKSRLEVAPRMMADIPVLRANRPRHTAMTPFRLEKEFGHLMSDWKVVLRRRVEELINQAR